MIPPEQRSWYYFGCRGTTGHYLFDKEGRSAYIDVLSRLDGELCPEDKTPYRAVLTRIPHLEYSALAWWDNSVDRRPGSNSIVFSPSLTGSSESIRIAMKRWFPWVEARLPKPLTLLTEERIYHEPLRHHGR